MFVSDSIGTQFIFNGKNTEIICMKLNTIKKALN